MAVFDLLYNKYLETVKISFNKIIEPKFTKDNITITIKTNEDKINPEEEVKKVEYTIFENWMF